MFDENEPSSLSDWIDDSDLAVSKFKILPSFLFFSISDTNLTKDFMSVYRFTIFVLTGTKLFHPIDEVVPLRD